MRVINKRQKVGKLHLSILENLLRQEEELTISDYLDDNDFLHDLRNAVSDLDIAKSIKFHEEHKLATITAVYPQIWYRGKNNKVTRV